MATSLQAQLQQSTAQPVNFQALRDLMTIWLERARFRAKLRADLREDPRLLGDIGISSHEAQTEVTRLFWEPTILTRR